MDKRIDNFKQAAETFNEEAARLATDAGKLARGMRDKVATLIVGLAKDRLSAYPEPAVNDRGEIVPAAVVAARWALAQARNAWPTLTVPKHGTEEARKAVANVNGLRSVTINRAAVTAAEKLGIGPETLKGKKPTAAPSQDPPAPVGTVTEQAATVKDALEKMGADLSTFLRALREKEGAAQFDAAMRELGFAKIAPKKTTAAV